MSNQAELVGNLETAQQILESIGCVRALTISLMLKYGLYTDILALRVSPNDHLSPLTFRDAYTATRLLQKSAWLPTGIDKKKVAWESFCDSESKCRETNDRFLALSEGRYQPTPAISLHLERARRKISDVLSRFSPYDFLDHCGFGPGSDFSTCGGFTSAYNKLDSLGSVTRECSLFVDFLAQSSSLGRVMSWDIESRSISIERVRGNRVAFVPKDCKTDRCIAVEPRWNVFFQKGLGRVIRRALSYSGIDLNDQGVNQRLAFEGSITDKVATLDLKSASDTVSLELVNYLVPQPWLDILGRLRSSHSLLPSGDWVCLNKWSSMGNGYTFELESLIFYALAGAVCGYREVSVYGDDLVVPSNLAPEVVELLVFCGFSLNSEKSFVTGPFRESCGSDFYNGVLCTPLYWKESLNAKGTLRLVNQITRLALRDGGGHFRDRRYRRVWGYLVHRIPNQKRVFGPTTSSDCIHAPSEKWHRFRRFGWCGWHVRVILTKTTRFRYRNYDAAVLSQFFSPSSDGYAIRDRTRTTLGTVFVPSGYEDIGPWV